MNFSSVMSTELRTPRNMVLGFDNRPDERKLHVRGVIATLASESLISARPG